MDRKFSVNISSLHINENIILPNGSVTSVMLNPSTGYTGYTGPQVIQGIQGIQGIKRIQGIQGATGCTVYT